MNIYRVKYLTQIKSFFITDHAFLEAFKDGILMNDIIWCLKNGKIIEQYPERQRCLIFAQLPRNIFIHIVIDYFDKKSFDVVTIYIPDEKHWIKGRIRKFKLR